MQAALAAAALSLTVLAAAGCQKRLASNAWEIIPGERVGLVDRSQGEIDLQMAYGAENTQRAAIALGEGETAPGTIVFGDDPRRRLEVLWHDVPNRRYPAIVFVSGDESLWQLPQGVTLGTSLHDLERLNGRPFILAGFGWDYAGAVLSWNGGALGTVFGTETKVYLAPPTSDLESPLYSQALGDRPFSSSSHPMRTLNPKIRRIRVEFPPPRAVTEAPDAGGGTATDTLATDMAGRDTSGGTGAGPGRGRGPSPLVIDETSNGQTFTYPVGTRFTLRLNEERNPGHTLLARPEGIVGRIASVPSVDPPLYAVRYEAVRPGRTTIRSRGFVITVVVTEDGGAQRP